MARAQQQKIYMSKTFTKEEIAAHNSEESCWIVAHGRVYDVTSFLNDHPAGPKCILKRAGGVDASQDYDFHSSKGHKLWKKYEIGKVEAKCSVM